MHLNSSQIKHIKIIIDIIFKLNKIILFEIANFQ
jgi:hypothetical protein